MSPACLLEHFDRLIDTPDAVPRLRRFILDLAVRGKLVEQDPKDEPAGELLKRIQAEKKRLEKVGVIKGMKQISPLSEAELPFEAPQGWEWAKLGDLCKFENGDRSKTYPSRDQLVEHGIPFINAGHLRSGQVCLDSMNFITAEKYNLLKSGKVKRGDILFCLRGSLGKSAIVNTLDVGAIASSLVIIRLFEGTHKQYLMKYLSGTLADGMIKKYDNGTAQPNLAATDLARFLLPLPPLAEQLRIVAKVDELMALCDELEAAQTKREKRRGRLVAATLHGLNNDDTTPTPGAPFTFEESARFYFNHLPRLTTSPEHIHQLRQTILNLAVRGKLVPQNLKEKALVGVEFTKVHKSEIPFEIPGSWCWTRLKHLGHIRGGGTPSKARPELWGGDIPWVSPKDMKRDYIDSAQMSITAKGIEESAVKLVETGSILFVVRGMILAHSFPVALTVVPVTVNQDMKALTPHVPAMGEFILRALKGSRDAILSKVQRSSHGTCRLESMDYEDLLFSLPPLAEQHRIVAKMDELMGLCEALETQIETGNSSCQRLLEAELFNAIPS